MPTIHVMSEYVEHLEKFKKPQVKKCCGTRTISHAQAIEKQQKNIRNIRYRIYRRLKKIFGSIKNSHRTVKKNGKK